MDPRCAFHRLYLFTDRVQDGIQVVAEKDGYTFYRFPPALRTFYCRCQTAEEQMSFRDYFSAQSDIYARSRPRYPEELFRFLASIVKQKELAWDCGTGNGQAAVSLSRYFKKVMA